jgi:hypothetical protein
MDCSHYLPLAINQKEKIPPNSKGLIVAQEKSRLIADLLSVQSISVSTKASFFAS